MGINVRFLQHSGRGVDFSSFLFSFLQFESLQKKGTIHKKQALFLGKHILFVFGVDTYGQGRQKKN